MRSDVGFYPSNDFNRHAQVFIYPAPISLGDIIEGAATGAAVELTAYARRVTQTHNSARVVFSVNRTFVGIQPCVGAILQITGTAGVLFNGVIDKINPFNESRGARSVTVQARSRDGLGAWRGQRVRSPVFPVGTEITNIVRGIALDLGLTEGEIDLPVTGYVVPHDNAQFVDVTPWEMARKALEPVGLVPMIDAIGRLKTFNNYINREPDLILDKSRVLSITGNTQTIPISKVKVRWLDPDLSEATQQDQILGTATITAGFFQLEQNVELYWSEDQTQRARNTRLAIKQSVNSGLLPVGSESYQEINLYRGLITVETSVWVPSLAVASLATMFAATLIPDAVAFGETIPIGRIVHGAAEVAILLIMMSMGTGVYEVWGQPYDYIHQRRTTEAYNELLPEWVSGERVIENDLISGQETSNVVAVQTLTRATAEVNGWGADVVDDPRIEVGDILGLPDGSRLYVTGYSRNVNRGAAAVLKLSGFRA